MRVGCYVDAFNVYYGGRGLVGGRGIPGWRWLDVRRLLQAVVDQQSGWTNPQVSRVVYCTARVSASGNPSGQIDQDVYLRALVAAQAVDVVELGRYVNRVAVAPLAVKNRSGSPVLVTANWPVMVHDSDTRPVNGARFMVSVARREEKGSDVNVALPPPAGRAEITR